jgi:peptide deformylase
MSSDRILLLGDPRLRRPAAAVQDFADPQLRRERDALTYTLECFRAEKGYGRGLAAPQMGIAKRLIAINLGDGPRCLINPVVTWRSAETFTLWDDCMCFPELLVRVRRHQSVSLTCQDADGQPQQWEHLGRAESELLQHEIDHLDGILAIDHALDTHSIIYRKVYQADPASFHKLVDYVIQPTV